MINKGFTVVPSKKCKFPAYKTLFLTSDMRNDSNEIVKKHKIIEYKNHKNSFMTFYSSRSDGNIYQQYTNLLVSQGIIKSNNIYGDNNFFLSQSVMRLIKYNKSIFEFNNFQKFDYLYNHEVFRKDTLYMYYLDMKKIFDKEYDFMVETYNYPVDKDIIKKKFKNYTFDMKNLWLVKPKKLFCGIGIKILDSFDNIKRGEFLITRYLTNLDLINNKKYDLRLHVLITGLKPLRIYFYKEGLIRRATKNFSLDEKSIKNKYIHLTNIAVNIKSKDYIIPNDTKIDDASMWNLHIYSNYLKKLGIDYNILRNKIKDIIIKSIISVYRNLTLELSKNNLNDMNFYNLLGYDILIKDNYEPILLEINSFPTKTYHSNLDKTVFTNLVIDTLNLIGISLFSKNIIHKRLFKSKKYDVEDYVNNALCELTRPRGDYELIFPLPTNINKYKKYFRNINIKENELFWEKIRKE